MESGTWNLDLELGIWNLEFSPASYFTKTRMQEKQINVEQGFSLIQDKLTRWWVFFVQMLPNFVLALLALGVFIFAARFIRRIAQRIALRLSKSESVASLVAGVIYAIVIVLGLMTALDIMKLEKTVSSLLAGVGIIGLALGFAFQDLTANFISGAFITFKKPFEIGHIVETNGFTGTIQEIRLRSTTLRTSAGLHVIIPNKEIFQKPIINYSRTEERRVELEFAIANTVDITFIEAEIKKALASAQSIKNAEVYFSAIEDPKIKINVSFWTENKEPREYMQARHQAILAIYHLFAQHKVYNIQIPAPPQPPQPI
jgi:small conductance mechanosensitive channel